MTMNKVLLRKRMAKLIGGMSSVEKQEQSRAVFDKLIKHPKYTTANRLSIYLSTDNELDTKPILKHALEVDGKQCFIPFVRKSRTKTTKTEEEQQQVNNNKGTGDDDHESLFSSRMIMVQLESMKDFEELPVNHYGIKEHTNPLCSGVKVAKASDNGADDLFLCLVPGVAFASDGRRLGHGRGYYDEFLSNWQKSAKEVNSNSSCAGLYTIGLAFEQQLVPDPCAVDGHDFKLDEVLTASNNSTDLEHDHQ